MLSTALFCLVASASPIKVAAARFNVVDVSESRADFYTEHLATRLTDEGVTVITPREITSLLGLERQKQLLGCSEGECIVEISNALGVDGLVLGDLAKVGANFQLNVKIIAANDGRRLAAKSVNVASEGELLEALSIAATQLAADVSRALGKPLGEKRANTIVLTEPSGAKKFWWAPAIAGVVIGAGGAVGLGLAESNRAQLVAGDLSAPQADALLANGQTARTLGWVGIGVGAAAIGTGLVMLLVGKDAPAVPVASVSGNGAVIGLTGRLP